MNRFRSVVWTLVTTLIVAMGFATATAPAAQASPLCSVGGTCGWIQHYSPDEGYDDPIRARCNYGDSSTGVFIYEGQNSSNLCLAHNSQGDLDQVYVRENEEIFCIAYYIGGGTVPVWEKMFDAQGWYKIGDDDGWPCVLHRD